jgi:Na+/melibiose symporter-like transporter
MLLAIMSFFWAFFLTEGDIWQYAVICIFSGIAFGADLAIPPSMLADQIHEQNNEHHAALQFGIFAFLAKAALAIGSAFVFTFLDWSGFRAAKGNTGEALFFLSLTYAAIPCAIKLCAAAILWRISPTQLGENHDQNTTHNPDTNRSHPHA